MNCYDKNDTMKMLGQQHIITPFWQNDEVRKEIREISEARPFCFSLEAASDIFMLGYIHGKRAERAKKRGALHE